MTDARGRIEVTREDLDALLAATEANCECQRAPDGRVLAWCGMHRLLGDGNRVAVLIAERHDAQRLIDAEHDPRAHPSVPLD